MKSSGELRLADGKPASQETAGTHATGRGSSAKHSERGADLYETPRCAIDRLIDHEPLPMKIWEPACGRGAISEPLKESGREVHSSDILDYGYGIGRVNFLETNRAPFGFDCIVTNPPYKLDDEFVRHGLTLVPRVIVLMRLAYLQADMRFDLMNDHLERLWVFKDRLPMMHRDGWEGKKVQSGSIPFAWFVFSTTKIPGAPWQGIHIGRDAAK